MSLRPTHITDEIYSYILNNFAVEDEFLKQLREDAVNEDIPEICISAEQASFIQFLLKTLNAKYVLEIGSLAGYSAITMARAIKDKGKVVTVEIDPDRYKFILKKIIAAKLDRKIEAHNDVAIDFLEDYNPGIEFDFVFIDADKENYENYFKLTTPHLRKGGIIACDNALAFGDIVSEKSERDIESVNAIREFNQFFLAQEGFQKCLVPVGDGMIMGIKL